jgi:hypothetical protein
MNQGGVTVKLHYLAAIILGEKCTVPISQKSGVASVLFWKRLGQKSSFFCYNLNPCRACIQLDYRKLRHQCNISFPGNMKIMLERSSPYVGMVGTQCLPSAFGTRLSNLGKLPSCYSQSHYSWKW